jgi:glycosyltransferase involved in cell wall biosynthesis
MNYLNGIQIIKNKFFTIPNGIDDMWFNNIYEQNTVTEHFKNKRYFVWWGFGSNRKNLERLLTAYSLVKERNRELSELLLIGKISEDLNNVSELIDKNKYIHIIPFQPLSILKEFVRNSSGLLFPSLYEGFGLPIIETYSQGRPVLYGSVTSMPEIASSFGIPVDPNDTGSIMEGLNKMDDFVIDRIYEDQVKSYANNFTYSKAAEKLSLVLNSL